MNCMTRWRKDEEDAIIFLCHPLPPLSRPSLASKQRNRLKISHCYKHTKEGGRGFHQQLLQSFNNKKSFINVHTVKRTCCRYNTFVINSVFSLFPSPLSDVTDNVRAVISTDVYPHLLPRPCLAWKWYFPHTQRISVQLTSFFGQFQLPGWTLQSTGQPPLYSDPPSGWQLINILLLEESGQLLLLISKPSEVVEHPVCHTECPDLSDRKSFFQRHWHFGAERENISDLTISGSSRMIKGPVWFD